MKRRQNNSGTIYKMSGNRAKPYAVRVSTGEKTLTADGKGIYKMHLVGTYATYDEAEYALAVYKRSPKDTRTGYFTVNDVWKQYLKSMENRLSENTLANYKSQYKKLAPIYDRDISTLDVLECQAVIDAEPSPAMKNKVKQLICNLIDYCPALNITPRQIQKNLYAPSVKSKEKTVFTNEEMEALWRLDRNKYSEALLIMLYSGMRIGEVNTIDPARVHLDERYLVGGEKTDAGKDRTIPIRQEIVPVLHDFLGENRISTSSFTAGMQRYLQSVDLPHTSHEARHTFISLAMQSGVPLPTIQQVVGHTSGSVTTSVYTHIPTDQLIKAVDSIVFCW